MIEIYRALLCSNAVRGSRQPGKDCVIKTRLAKLDVVLISGGSFII
jgi:hypothetical protein